MIFMRINLILYLYKLQYYLLLLLTYNSNNKQMDSDDDFKQQKHIAGSPKITHLQQLRYPLNQIVRVIIQIQGQQAAHGTGCLIQDGIVLTCLHNLIIGNELVDKSILRVIVGQNGQLDPTAVFRVKDYKYNSNYFITSTHSKQTKKAKAFDYALLQLQPHSNKIRIDKRYKLSIYKPPTDSNLIFELYGYDGRQNDCYNQYVSKGNGYRLFGCQATAYSLSERFIQYKVSTQSGKSGAPLVISNGMDLYRIIGIHLGANGKSETNFALRINEQIIQNINKWRDQWQTRENRYDRDYFPLSYYKVSNRAVDYVSIRTRIQKGLNLEGVCINQNCIIKNRKIWVNKGFGFFNMNKEVHISKCPNPTCKKNIQLIGNMGLYMGKVQCLAKMQGEQPKKKQLFIDNKDDFLIFFDNNKQGISWNFMELNVIAN